MHVEKKVDTDQTKAVSVIAVREGDSDQSRGQRKLSAPIQSVMKSFNTPCYLQVNARRLCLSQLQSLVTSRHKSALNHGSAHGRPALLGVDLILSSLAKVAIYEFDWRSAGRRRCESVHVQALLALASNLHTSLASEMSKTAQDLVAGTAGGIAQVKST